MISLQAINSSDGVNDYELSRRSQQVVSCQLALSSNCDQTPSEQPTDYEADFHDQIIGHFHGVDQQNFNLSVGLQGVASNK